MKTALYIFGIYAAAGLFFTHMRRVSGERSFLGWNLEYLLGMFLWPITLFSPKR